MKNVLAMLVLVLFSTFATAQKSPKGIPAEVIAAFQKQFPNVNEVEWEKEDGNYEAEFKINNIENSALFNSKGDLIETEAEIQLSELPAGVIDYVKTNYSGKKVKEASKITDAAGILTFEAEVKGMDLIFDSQGKFIKSVKK